MDITIRKAKSEDAHILTKITFESKSHWNYPDDWMRIWEDELTVTQQYIHENAVFVAEGNGSIAGLYSVVLKMNNIDLI